MGCRAITPSLVSLAKRLENAPFHLLFTDGQRKPEAEMIGYIKSLGAPAGEATAEGR